MAGLILLAALGALISALIWLSGRLTRRLPLPDNCKTLLRVAIVVGAFPLMLIDEIIGKYQFEALCKANGIESVDISKAAKMQVKIKYGDRTPVAGNAVPILESEVTIHSTKNEAPIFKYKNYYADGGWIMRHTFVNMGYPQPMLFNGNGCGFAFRDRIFSENMIFITN